MNFNNIVLKLINSTIFDYDIFSETETKLRNKFNVVDYNNMITISKYFRDNNDENEIKETKTSLCEYYDVSYLIKQKDMNYNKIVSNNDKK
jgi:hypothetical protein